MAAGSDRRQIAEAVASEIKGTLGDRAHEVRLYGSVARGTTEETSDIDLLLVVDHKSDLQILSEIIGRWMARSGDVIHLLVVTPEEAADLERRETRFWKTIRREGEALA